MDRDAFSQILSNLLSNIEKYAGESAKARVVIDGGGNELTVEVADNVLGRLENAESPGPDTPVFEFRGSPPASGAAALAAWESRRA